MITGSYYDRPGAAVGIAGSIVVFCSIVLKNPCIGGRGGRSVEVFVYVLGLE